LFDDDYLFFYANILSDEVSDRQTDLIWRLLALEPGAQVLDLACGHGRIANRLAAKGATVTGLDVTARFLDRARADAQARGVEVDYVHGDMRELAWERPVRRGHVRVHLLRVLRRRRQPSCAAWRAACAASRRQLYLDLNHLPWLLRNFRDREVAERTGSG
jgi:SAM-dependent methyltransferase